MEKFYNLIRKIDSVVAFAEVGGSTQKDQSKDFDFLVVVTDHEATLLYFQKIFKTKILDDSIRILNYGDRPINLAVYTEEELFSKINLYLSTYSPLGEIREWAVGYWIPEIFIQDIENSHIIYDLNNQLNNIKQNICDTKMRIFNNFFNKVLMDIEIKTNLLSEAIPNSLLEYTLRNSIILSLYRLESLKSNKVRNFLNIDNCENDLKKLTVVELKNFSHEVKLLIGKLL
jgi:hypothetical protein